MSKDNRDISVISKILRYCDGIANSVQRFGSEISALESDEDYQDSVAMKILQIGELTTHLSDEFKASYNEIPWQDIKRMRNYAAHEYEKFNYQRMWGTMHEDIPVLREFCQRIIEQHEAGTK